MCLLSLQSWLIAYFSCLHIESWYTVLQMMKQWEPKLWMQQQLACVPEGFLSVRSDLGMHFEETVRTNWQFWKLWVVFFKASVHVLPMGHSCAVMAAFGSFSRCRFERHLYGDVPLFFKPPPFFSLFSAPPSCPDLPDSGAILQCICISQKKCISSLFVWETPSLHTHAQSVARPNRNRVLYTRVYTSSAES